MKGSLLNKMPGEEWQKLANLRALLGYMWAHPGKKLLFMGGEFGQWGEWNETESLDWHLLEKPAHRGLQILVRDLNRIYGGANTLWEADGESAGFQWIDADNAAENVVSFIRRAPSTGKELICVGHFSPLVREGHRLGLPRAGKYKQILNTDSEIYCGGGFGMLKTITAENVPTHGFEYSAEITLPPLAMMWFEAPRQS
ncbi:MAG: alpha amylase C-terminal domain-containing protein, partial [Acidobacteriota bacterium]|nr:alpha amylase C-terminal domain-containing protein [Acidobacteriota bacterium]